MIVRGNPLQQESLSLNVSISDPMIFGQYNPSVSPNAGQPFLVFSVWRKMIVVDVNGCPCLAESRGNSFLPKGTVEEKDWRFRRLRGRVRT